MEVPKDCSLADDFLRSAGIERTIAARGLCFFWGGEDFVLKVMPLSVQLCRVKHLTSLLFHTSSDAAPGTSCSSSGFSFSVSHHGTVVVQWYSLLLATQPCRLGTLRILYRGSNWAQRGFCLLLLLTTLEQCPLSLPVGWDWCNGS